LTSQLSAYSLRLRLHHHGCTFMVARLWLHGMVARYCFNTNKLPEHLYKTI